LHKRTARRQLQTALLSHSHKVRIPLGTPVYSYFVHGPAAAYTMLLLDGKAVVSDTVPIAGIGNLQNDNYRLAYPSAQPLRAASMIADET
jgi:hypothetical protein